MEDGSLFTSLLLPRAATVAMERLRPARRTSAEHGIGRWTAGPLVTAAVNRLLAADARFVRAAGRARVRLPGLSQWVFGVVR